MRATGASSPRLRAGAERACGWTGRTRGRGLDRGSVTVEAAFAVPALVAVTLLLVWVVGIGTAHLRVGDAARSAARLAARGEPDARVLDAAQRSAPGAQLSVSRDDETVLVTVWHRVRAPLPLVAGLGVDVEAQASAQREDALTGEWTTAPWPP
ncbi:MAG: TadE family type IV pilus minor pilin [Candidatus Nanopelagicales bacterium]